MNVLIIMKRQDGGEVEGAGPKWPDNFTPQIGMRVHFRDRQKVRRVGAISSIDVDVTEGSVTLHLTDRLPATPLSEHRT